MKRKSCILKKETVDSYIYKMYCLVMKNGSYSRKIVAYLEKTAANLEKTAG